MSLADSGAGDVSHHFAEICHLRKVQEFAIIEQCPARLQTDGLKQAHTCST